MDQHVNPYRSPSDGVPSEVIRVDATAVQVLKRAALVVAISLICVLVVPPLRKLIELAGQAGILLFIIGCPLGVSICLLGLRTFWRGSCVAIALATSASVGCGPAIAQFVQYGLSPIGTVFSLNGQLEIHITGAAAAIQLVLIVLFSRKRSDNRAVRDLPQSVTDGSRIE